MPHAKEQLLVFCTILDKISLEGGKRMQLGQMIVKIRKEQNLTQESFAKKFDVTRQTVSNWENEKSYPDLQTLVKISDMFNISLDILLKGDSNMVEEIDKRGKKNVLYKWLIIGLVIVVIALVSVIYFNDKSLSDTTKDHMNWKINTIKEIEVYDVQKEEVITKYTDQNSIQQFVSILNIENWEKEQKWSKDFNLNYTIKLYFDEDDKENINEINIYEDGKYTSIFVTYPGGVKEYYKSNIDISEIPSK